MKTLKNAKGGFWGGLLIFALLLWFVAPLAFAELPQVVKESFIYAEGTLGGLGDDAVGWGGPWEDVTIGYAEVVAEALPFTIIPTTGNVLQVFEGGTTYRDLSETWPDDGSTYWYSQLYQRFDGIDVDDSYNGLSLFMDGAELLYIGKPWATKNLGLDGSGVESDTASFDAYDGGWMVVQLIMSGDAENDDAYLWINPDPAVQPDTANADAHVKWKGSAGFNRVRIGSGNTPNQAECTYDEIRFSQTYAGLTSEEGEGVKDQTTSPRTFGLMTNYPNPFNPITTISYSLDRAEQISLEVYDALGHKVRTLFAGVQSAGVHNAQWNGVDENGQYVSSGLYIYRLVAGDRVATGKMTLLK
jgi:hypothetical protein